MSVLHELRHLPIEKREQQRANVSTIHIRIGHDDDAVIAELRYIVLILAYAGAQGLNKRHDFLRRDELVEPRLFDIQNLSLQRQDRLKLAVAALLCRAAGRVALHDIELALGRILFLAIREFCGQSERIENALPPCHLPCLARRLARARCVDDLPADDAGIIRPLEQEILQLLPNELLDYGPDLG